MLGAVLTSARPEFMRHFVGPEMIATMERHQMWTESIVSVAPRETSHIMTNNLSVSFVTFAGGITFGLGTFYYLFVNGMMLGVIGAACHQYGMSLALWSFVAAHGSLELPAIILPAAAGFRLGYAMLFPGALRWKDSVAQGGIEATRLVSRHHSPAGDCGMPGRVLLAFAGAGLAEVHRRRNAVYAAESLAVPASEAVDCDCGLRQAILIRSPSTMDGKLLFCAQKWAFGAVFRLLIPRKFFVSAGQKGFFRGNSLLFRMLRQKWGRGGVSSCQVGLADGNCSSMQRMAVMN